MVAIDTLRRITLEARAVGISEASAALGRLLSSNEAVLASIEKLDATDKKRRESLVASARQFDNTVAANDKAYGAAMRYAATVEKLERLLKSGSGSQEAYNVAMAAARAKFEDATQAAAGNAAATSRLAEEARALKAVLDPLGAAQDALSAKLKRYGEMALAGAIDEGELIEASLRAQIAFEKERDSLDGTTEAKRKAAEASARMAAEAKALKAAIDPIGAAQDALNAKLARYRELATAGEITPMQLAAGSQLAQGEFEATRSRYDGTDDRLREQAQQAREAAAESERLDQQVRALRASMDPLGAATDALNAKLALYGKMAAAGKIGEDELIEASLRAQLAFDEQRDAIDGTAAARHNLARENERLEATYLPLIKLEKDLAREQAAIAASSFSDVQKQIALSALEARAQSQREAIQRQQDPNRRSRVDYTGLSFQANDVVTMAAMGANPMQILATQGGQIFQNLQMSEGGPRQALKQIGADAAAAAGSMMRFAAANPLVTGGLVAATAAAGAFYLAVRDGLPSAEEALKRHADLVQKVREQYKLAAEAAKLGDPAKAPEGVLRARAVQNESVLRVRYMDAAQGLGLGLSLTGGPEEYRGAITDYLASLKKGEPDVKAFQTAVADIMLRPGLPAEIRALGDGLLKSADNAEEMRIRLAEAGVVIGAASSDAERLAISAKRSADALKDLKAMGSASIALTPRAQVEATYMIGMNAARDWEQQQAILAARTDALAELDRQLALTAASDALGIRSLTARTAAEKAAIAEEQKRIEIRRKWGEAGISTPEGRQAVSAAGQMVWAQASAQVAATLQQSAQSTAEITRSSQLQAATWGKSAGEVARLTEQARLYAEAARQGESLTAKLVDQIERAADASGRAADAADKANRARQAPLTARGDALALQSIYARSAEERAKIAEQQIMLEEARAGRPTMTAEVSARIKASRDQIYAQADVAARDALEQARLGAAAAGGRGLAGEVAQINAKYDALIRGAKGAADAVRDYNSARQIEIDMATRAAYASPLEQSDQQTREQIAATRLQAASFGQSAEQVAYLAEKTKLENEYARSGITLSRDLADAIEARARAAGRAAGETDRLTKAQQDAQRGLDEFRGTASSAIEALFRGDKGGIADAFESYGRNILVRTTSEGLFGKEGEAGGGMFGGLLGSAFGVTGKRGESAQNPLYVQPVGAGASGLYMGGLSGLPGMSGQASAGGGMANVLALSQRNTGLTENTAVGAINSLLAGSGTAQLDAKSQAWCAAYANAVLIQSGYAGTGSNMASSFLDWGQATNNPRAGDIVNLKSDYGSGHVGFFQGYDSNGNVLVHGGNQGYGRSDDGIGTVSYPLSQVLGYRTAAGGMVGAGYGAARPLDLTGGAGLQVDQTIGSLNTSLSSLTDGVGQIANQFVPGFGGVLSTLLNGMSTAAGGGGGFNLFSGLGSLFSGGGGDAAASMIGSIYANGGVPPGGLGLYRNTVVSRPTTFAFANGVGLMGEAGPEAIMPLKRDGAGRLGVSALGRPGSYDMARESRVSREERESTNHAKIEIAPTKDFEARIVSSATKESRRYTNNAVGQMGRELSKATPARVESYQKLGS